MPTHGELVVARALSYEGVVEATGRNDGQPIERWQARSGQKWGVDYSGAPWCAIYIENMVLEAGVSVGDPYLTHPYTGFICRAANEAADDMRPSGGYWPVGSWLIYCSVHVGIVVRDRGSVVDTIEGNGRPPARSGQGERALYRVAGRR
jgi:hypothetical protein